MSSEFDEILQVFFQETQEHLSMLGKKLQEWDAKNNEELARLPFEDINVLLRAAHSIKGNSATCGLENISMVSHAMVCRPKSSKASVTGIWNRRMALRMPAVMAR